MHDVRNAAHNGFEWDGDLLLDLFRRDSRPLRYDLHVIVGYVGIRFDGKLVEGNRAPNNEQQRDGEDEKAILQREIDELTNHAGTPKILVWSCRSRENL